MTYLSVVLEDRSETGGTYVSAIVNIYDITSERAVKQSKSNLVLDHNHLSVELEPGKYVVELRLPAGNLIRKEVEVKDQATQNESFDIGSPHEFLWLQRLVGNVGSRSEHKARLEKMISRDDFRRAPPRLTAWIVSSGTLSFVTRHLGVVPVEGYFSSYPEVQRPVHPYDRLAFPPENQQIATVRGDEFTRSFELGPRQVRDLTFQDRGIDDYCRSGQFERQYFLMLLDGLPQYSVLPIPWQNPDDGQQISVHINVNIDPSEKESANNYDTMHRIAVTVNDPYFSSLIGYLGSGELPSASLLLKRAQHVLFMKVSNPLAAAAGAYVLLEQTELDEHRPWHDWIRNLMNWYKWLPDGAIQWAWLQMAEQNMHATDDQIRTSLLGAYGRGLPYYSAGVKLLLNGLTVFAQRLKVRGRFDAEIEKALNNVRLLAIRIDRRQAFTSVIAD